MKQEEFEARIWQRVLHRPQTQPQREALCAWLADTQAAQRSYAIMARQSGRACYRAMAAQEAQQAKILSALLFLHYGQTEPVYSGAAEGGRSLLAAVRSRYAMEAQAQRTFSEAAERFPEHTQCLQEMAQRAMRHRVILQNEAARMLRQGSFNKKGLPIEQNVQFFC